MYTIVALTPNEEFLQFLDPDLCDIKETHETNGIRTIEIEYKFQQYEEDKALFKLGNKLWVGGDNNLTDCLYVINTSIKEDIYKENSFTCECEEVLVELNNAPLTSHLDVTTYPDVFTKRTINDSLEVKVDWNSLNYWFGDFFNMGVVQDCLNSSLQWIPFFGTFNLMTLLRYIEEQTNNVFITRYEKDQIDNTIHRYLDFLNPINVSKNWELHLEYDFIPVQTLTVYDSDWNEVEDEMPWDVVRYTNSHIEPESMDEIVSPYDPETDEALNQYDTLDTSYEWVQEDEEVIDEGTIKQYPIIRNINIDNTQMQIVDEYGMILNADGTLYEEGDDNALLWTATDLGMTSNTTRVLISLYEAGTEVGLCVNNKTYAVVGVGGRKATYVGYTNWISETTLSDNKRPDTVLPDDCYLEMYDTVQNKTVFRTCINRSIGHVHENILDFAFNMDNVQYDIDETDTYTAVAPILQLNSETGGVNDISTKQFTDLVTRYKALTVTKGEEIPMIMQKVQIQASTLEAAKRSLGGYVNNSGANESNVKKPYWVRPYKPQDSEDTSTPANSKWEFWQGTAYWNAPFSKKPGFEVTLDDTQTISYNTIYGRKDTRDDKGTIVYDKTATTESSDEDIFSIYNQCALYLKDHCEPKIELDVDVGHLEKGKFNDYQIWDKVYIKIEGTRELITARVVETTKEANNMSANTIKLSNYTTNTYKAVTHPTFIDAKNTSFKYPASKELTVRLENLEYDSTDPYSTHYPGNKLLNFTLYSVKDGNREFKKNYTKLTDVYGYAKLKMKYDPGAYELDIAFNGDEEYRETTTTVNIAVHGTKEVKSNDKNSTKSKTTKNTKKVTKTLYYDKYGRTPDKKKILAIGKRSHAKDGGTSGVFYGMEFKNKCPHCGKASLAWSIFYAGNEHSDYGRFPATGNMEGGSAEGHIFCTNQRCDADFSCQGWDHVSSGSNSRLSITKKRFKSTKSDAYKLKKGKYIYAKKTVTVSKKNNSNTKSRKIIGKPSSKVKAKALSIVGNKTGYKAMRAICNWMDKNIHYKYYCGFCRSPDQVLKTNHGNCCDQTRLILSLFDAAGVGEYYDMYFVNLSCPSYGHVYGRIRSKKSGNWVNVDPASDSYGCYGYVCDSCNRKAPVSSKYPKLPFNSCNPNCS